MKHQIKLAYILRALMICQAFNMYLQPTIKHLLLLIN